MSLHELQVERHEHPLDLVERLATLNDWSFDRAAEDEIAIAITGAWTEYNVAFTWLEDMEAVHVACAFPLKAPERRKAELLQLIALANEQLWLGHFDLWPSENVIMFRHSLLLSGGMAPSITQCERALQLAVEACEKYYQAFQFTVWAGQSARDAMNAAMFTTMGEA